MNNDNKLSGICNKTLQYNRTLNINTFDNLTIISAQSGSGKNTLMYGIMLGYHANANFLVLTESREDYRHHKISEDVMSLQYVSEINLETILSEFEQTKCNNLFIEQYLGCDKTKQFEDLNYLREYSKTTGKNIYICVHLPRQKL